MVAEQLWAFFFGDTGSLTLAGVVPFTGAGGDHLLSSLRRAGIGWLLAFLPWVLRSARIYLAPRVDGKPG